MGKVWPWTDRLREMVLIGPVSVAEAMAEMSALVPPGRAYRDGESQVVWQQSHAASKSPKRRANVTPVAPVVPSEEAKDARIRRGARRLAYQAIWHQQRSGHVEFYVESGIRMVRLGQKAWATSDE